MKRFLPAAALGAVTAMMLAPVARAAPTCSSEPTRVPSLTVELGRAPVLIAGRSVKVAVRVTRWGTPQDAVSVETLLVGDGWAVGGFLVTEEDGRGVVTVRLPRSAPGEIDVTAMAERTAARLPCSAGVVEAGSASAAWGVAR